MKLKTEATPFIQSEITSSLFSVCEGKKKKVLQTQERRGGGGGGGGVNITNDI